MKNFALSELDIVGFASFLKKPTLPRVLAPVFRVRAEPETFLLPPFSLVGDQVCEAGRAGQAEVEDFVTQREVTRLPEAIPAKLGHDLWTDQQGQVSYQAKSAVKAAFEAIFTRQLASAREKLTQGNYAEAGEHAAIARAVKPAHLDPLVVRAAAEKLRGLEDELDFTRELAGSYVDGAGFEALVNALVAKVSTAEARRRSEKNLPSPGIVGIGYFNSPTHPWATKPSSTPAYRTKILEGMTLCRSKLAEA